MSFANDHRKSPQCFRRSASLRLPGEAPRNYPRLFSRADERPHKLGELHCSNNDSKEVLTPDELDNDSLLSCSSAGGYECSYVPLNGTTFSGRSKRYVHHCSTHAGLSDDYLTPTQRAQKQIRKLKALLFQAKKELEDKDNEIYKLTKEIVEIKLEKTKLCSPEDKSNSSDVVTIKENSELNSPSQDAVDGIEYLSPTRSRDMQSSSDSGHFDDLTIYSSNCKDYNERTTSDVGVNTDINGGDWYVLKSIYEKKIEELCRLHTDEISNLKEKHNDKVEALLHKLSEVNDRYCELVPGYDEARQKITDLERQLEEASKRLALEEEKNQNFKKYSERVEVANENASQVVEVKEVSTGVVNRVSVSQLVDQLQITQKELENVRAMYRRIIESRNTAKSPVDAEVTLQFLKSAVYYFLTDPENHQGHLRAIESILGFTEEEKSNIEKMRSYQ